MAVLVDQEEPPVVGTCDDVHPVGIFQHVIGGDACAAGEFDGFAPHGEPRLMRQIFAVQDFPGSVIGLFHGNSLFGKDTIFLRFRAGAYAICRKAAPRSDAGSSPTSRAADCTALRLVRNLPPSANRRRYLESAGNSCG